MKAAVFFLMVDLFLQGSAATESLADEAHDAHSSRRLAAPHGPTRKPLLTAPSERDRRMLCDELPFLPALCRAQLRAPRQFRVNTTSTYATLCDYGGELSLGDPAARQCLVLALSLLGTAPRQGFTLMVPEGTAIEAGYQRVLDHLRVRVHRFAPFALPPEAVTFHEGEGQRPGWVPAYQKLNVWALPGMARAVFLDSDSVVLRNLDHLFLEANAMGCDCNSHNGDDAAADWAQNDAPNSGLLVTSPSPDTFASLMRELAAGVDADTGAWRYGGGDQDLIKAALSPMLLPADMLMFPDVCRHADVAGPGFPVDDAYVIHYTWGWGKGYEIDLHPATAGPAEACSVQFAKVYKFFNDGVDAVASHLHHQLRKHILQLPPTT